MFEKEMDFRTEAKAACGHWVDTVAWLVRRGENDRAQEFARRACTKVFAYADINLITYDETVAFVEAINHAAVYGESEVR